MVRWLLLLRRSFLPTTNSHVDNRVDNRGSASLVGALCIGLAAAFSVAAAKLGEIAINDARAHIAAEAAALAGALTGANAAEEIANQNNAQIVEYSIIDETALVVVEIKGIRASARATVVDFSTLGAWHSPTDSSP